MKKSRLYPVIILILGLVFYFPFLGSVHLFDWDEINFAESAREMIVTNNYSRIQINFEPFWEKPPLFFWLQVLSMKLFGINEFAARFPNAVFGIITLLSLFFIGKKLYDEKFGFIWALACLGSFLPRLYFKSGIIDPVFNYFIFLSLVFLSKTVTDYQQKGASGNAILAGIFIGLSILTKGPAGFLMVLLALIVFWMWKSFRPIISFKNLVLFGLFSGLVSMAWFSLEIIKNGPWFLEEFIRYQVRLFSTPDAGHSQPFYYHFIVVFLGCFPLSVFAIRSFYNDFREHNPVKKEFRIWMIIIFWVCLILFSIVKTKIVHYSSLTYFPLSFLAAYHLYHLQTRKLSLGKYTGVLILLVGFIISLGLVLFPFVGMFKRELIPYIKDEFAVANLDANVYWSGFEGLIGILYFISIIFACVNFKKMRLQLAYGILFLSTAACLWLYSAIVVPKIEAYTQAAAIRFYQSLKGRDIYIHTIGFKSYAHLFYSEKPRVSNKNSYNEAWLLTGSIDKPAYFVTKITGVDQMKAYPEAKLIKVENGFAFYRREPLKK